MEELRDLVKRNPRQMNYEEYKYVADHILSCKNILIFGLGKDSMIWNNLNPNIVFVEDNQFWIDQYHDSLNNIIKVEYFTKVKNFEKDKLEIDKLFLSNIPDKKYDLIVVDAPVGGKKEMPGRLQSIYTARYLMRKHVLIHDLHRELEQRACDLFFKNMNYNTIRHLRHYCKEEQL